MATSVPFHSQLSSIMEVLVKAAVAEISKLVDDKCAFLHHEISCKQSEIESLQRKLLMMEGKTAQLQRGFENYMDRGTDVESNCPRASAGIKFPEMEEATVSFTIKEESPDETLWIRDSAGQVGSALQYPNLGYLAGSQQLDENHQLSHADASRQKNSDFGGELYTSGQQGAGDVGLQFTVKTEKEDRTGGFSQGGCQHGTGKPSRLATADFSADERENQLWSSLIDGQDIDAGFPDFSSVVDEYSNAFPSNSHCSTAKAAAGQQQQQQQQCNGDYSGEFQPQCAELQQDEQKEPAYSQRKGAGEAAERRQIGHGSLPHPPPHPHPPPAGATRSPYVCPQCGKQFGRLHQFKLHQQSHRRKWDFWCTVCGKNFQCSSHLSIHHRTHTGERPYGCGQCGKRFTQQSSLRVHQRTHSGERPYSCTLCGKTFILMHHLKRHRIIHTYS